MLPAHCNKCQLCFKSLKSYKLPNEFSTLPFSEGVLFVGSRPSKEDDTSGILFSPESKAGQFLRLFLKRLEEGGISWCLSSVTLCGDGTEYPTKEQIGLCSTNHLVPLINNIKPKIVVALGLDAWEELIGTGVRADLPKKTPEGLWIIPSYNPEDHVKSTRDLRIHLQEVATWINNIYLGKYDNVQFDYERIHSKTKALAVARELGPEVFIDIETEYSGTCPTKLNYWGRDSELIMFAVTYKTHDGVYKNYVFESEAMCSEVVKTIITGRHVFNHNIGFDINGIYRFCGQFCVFKHARKITDTLFEHWFADQSSIRNGLKDLTEKHFLVPDYSAELKQEVKDVNEAYYKEERDRIHEENTRRRKERAKLGIQAKYNPTAKVNDINFEEEESHNILVNELIYDRHNLSENERRQLRPLWKQPDTLGYKYVNRDKLARYAAQDTYYTARLWYEILDKRPEDQKPDPRIMKIAYNAMETLCKISRVGLPINMDKVVKLRELTKTKVKDLYMRILTNPAVHKAIYNQVPEVKEILAKYKKSQTTNRPIRIESVFQALCSVVNPNGKKLTKALINEYNPEVYEWGSLTPGGDLKINKDVMKPLGNVVDSEEEVDAKYGYNYSEPRSLVEWAWHDIFWFKQNSKTLGEFLKKFVGYRGVDGCIHPSYHLSSTSTGRTASKEPNGQNLKNDPAIMSCMECPDGYEFWGFDYVSVEPVTMAIVANIPAWKEVFINEYDLYSIIANDVYADELKELGLWIDRAENALSKEAVNKIKKQAKHLRKAAKTGTLGKTYGQSAKSFAMMYRKALDEVQRFYEGFAAAYPELDQYVDNTENEIKESGIVRNGFGRKRTFKYSRDRRERAAELRQAANYKIQSLANDIALIQAHRITKYLEKYYPDVLLCNFVHDAIYFIGPTHLRDEVIPKIQELMQDNSIPELEGVWDVTVPIRTSVKYSKTLAGLLDG